jgi:hypothetical protein
MKDLAGKRACITGGASGTGMALERRLALGREVAAQSPSPVQQQAHRRMFAGALVQRVDPGNDRALSN